MNKTRDDVEQLLRDQHFQGQVVATGDTDPKLMRDELSCEQTPKFGKIQPTGTITVKYCNTYKKPDDGPQLVGLSVEAAKQKAIAAGFTGTIEVMQLYDFDASCKEGNVCRVDPVRWYLNQEYSMQLMVNKKISISTPDQ
jgi:beta-lactam-binding protein with PASTA domain